MIKALIVEDEQLAAEKLEMLLKNMEEDIEIADKLESIESVVNWLSNNTVDLIFMDIHLSDGLCFNIFEHIMVKTPIIFTTAYDNYAIKAFKQNSVDYLLKPIDDKELKQSLAKFNEIYNKKNDTIDYNKFARLFLNKLPEYKSRLMVYAGNKVISIKTDNIAFIYAHEKAVYITSKENKSYYINKTLDKLEQMLDSDTFFRLNRKIIAHIDTVKEAYSYSKNKMKVIIDPSPDFEVFVPIERINGFKSWLNR